MKTRQQYEYTMTAQERYHYNQERLFRVIIGMIGTIVLVGTASVIAVLITNIA